jgi:hypothetical protein
MAQTGYTPIKIYSSSTASAVPLAANLAQGELAINTLDGKLYYKNSSGVVTLLANSGATNVSSITFGSTGLTPNTATTGAVTVAGLLATGYGGTGLTTFTAANNAVYSTSASVLTAGTLPLLAGGTGATTVSGAQTNLQVDSAGTAVAMAIALG